MQTDLIYSELVEACFLGFATTKDEIGKLDWDAACSLIQAPLFGSAIIRIIFGCGKISGKRNFIKFYSKAFCF